MTTALTAFLAKANVPALSDAALADALEKGQQVNGAQGQDSSGVQYLSFSGKTGRYALGKAKDDIDPEDTFLVEPMSLLAGWVCWKGGKPVERTEWSFFGGKAVSEDDLTDHSPYNTKAGEGWASLLGFGCLPVGGDAAGNVKFSSNTVSAKNAITDLIEEIKTRSRNKEPALPLIHFEKEQFTAQGQSNYKPKFVVETWVTREQATCFFTGAFSAEDLLEGKKPTKAQIKKLEA
jgi:hypothetical protein